MLWLSLLQLGEESDITFSLNDGITQAGCLIPVWQMGGLVGRRHRHHLEIDVDSLTRQLHFQAENLISDH